MIKYITVTDKSDFSVKHMWDTSEPFTNASVKRMLTVAHGTYCMIDLSDATIRSFITSGGSFNATEFFMRLNLPGLGRFTISLYGEAKRGIEYKKAEKESLHAQREKLIIEEYLAGLYEISEIYNDRSLISFVDDFKKSDMYKEAFEKTIKLAELREVPEGKIIRSKDDIDDYFIKGIG